MQNDRHRRVAGATGLLLSCILLALIFLLPSAQAMNVRVTPARGGDFKSRAVDQLDGTPTAAAVSYSPTTSYTAPSTNSTTESLVLVGVAGGALVLVFILLRAMGILGKKKPSTLKV